MEANPQDVADQVYQVWRASQIIEEAKSEDEETSGRLTRPQFLFGTKENQFDELPFQEASSSDDQPIIQEIPKRLQFDDEKEEQSDEEQKLMQTFIKEIDSDPLKEEDISDDGSEESIFSCSKMLKLDNYSLKH